MGCRKQHGAGDTIAVVGLGYVGLPLALEFSQKTKVIGYDVSEKRIRACRENRDSTVVFSSDPGVLDEASVFIIAVPTPVYPDHSADLSFLREASITVAAHMTPGSLIVYESTVYPGVTEEVCIPLLSEYSAMKPGEDFFVGYSPERVSPGSGEYTLTRVNKLISGQDPETLLDVERVYSLIFDESVKGKLCPVESIRVAEAAKVVENAQRDVNIAFMNEVSCMMGILGIDTRQVMEAMKTKWNYLPFRPGLVGGHCIGVDPYYLIQKAESCGFSPGLLRESRKINEAMPYRIALEVVQRLLRRDKELSHCRVFVLGVTFKENVPDMRNSRVEQLVGTLRDYGIYPEISDPVADPGEILAVYGRRPLDLCDLLDGDCLILCAAHEAFSGWRDEDFSAVLRPGALLVDVCGVYSRSRMERLGYEYCSL